MTKKLTYIMAGLITLLWIILQLDTGNSIYDLNVGLVGIGSLLLFATAWKLGKNDEKPFIFAILLSLAGFFTPLIVELAESREIDPEFLEILLYLLPIIPACIIGHFTRKHNRSVAAGTLLNAIPGIIICALSVVMCMVVGFFDRHVLYANLYDVETIAVFALVTLLSAYAEAHTDKEERRTLQIKCWWFFLLLLLFVEIRNTDAAFSFGKYAYDTFLPLFRICLPFIFWQLKNWLEMKIKNHTVQTISYLGSALILNILQAGVFYYLLHGFSISVYYWEGVFPFDLSIEWMLIGTVMAVVVYWQEPVMSKLTGIISSLVFIFACLGLLFVKSEHLREVIYNLGGPAVNIDLSTRFDLMGYRLESVKAFVTGNLLPLYEKYGNSGDYGYTIGIRNGVFSIPLAFSLVIAILVLTVIVAIFLVKRAGNRSVAKIFAIAIGLQAAIFTVESVCLIDREFDPAFAGAYVAAFLLMWKLLRPVAISEESVETPLVQTVPIRKGIKIATAALVLIVALCDIGFIIDYNTDIGLIVLDSYKITDEDAAEWDAASDRIVQIIAEEEPYYVAENRVGLSEEDASKWEEESTQFVEEFLDSDLMNPTTAREIAGQYYIKSSVAHALLGDDTHYVKNSYCYRKGYVPYARLSELSVKKYSSGSDSLSVNLNGWFAFMDNDEFTEKEKTARETLYGQVAEDSPNFFSQYDEPVLRYCFADAVYTLQK